MPMGYHGTVLWSYGYAILSGYGYSSIKQSTYGYGYGYAVINSAYTAGPPPLATSLLA